MFLISPTTENISRFLLLHINTNERLNYKINLREKQQSFYSPPDAYFNTVLEIYNSLGDIPGGSWSAVGVN